MNILRRGVCGRLARLSLILGLTLLPGARAVAATDYWTATPPMGLSVTGAIATPLSNGKVLLTGGGATGGVIASAELYDPVSNTWSAAGAMNVSRDYHTATLLQNGKVLVVGGYDGSAGTTEVDLYDPSSGSWTAVAPLNVARAWHTASLLSNGEVLVAGGGSANEFTVLTSAEIYNPTANTWTLVAPMQTGRSIHVAATLNTGDVLVAGGWDGNEDTNSAELYSPQSNSWTVAASMVNTRDFGFASLLSNGEILVSGGVQPHGSDPITSAPDVDEIYNPATATWHSSRPDDNGEFSFKSALLTTGQLLSMGSSFVSGAQFDTVAFYDPSTDSWNDSAASPLQLMSGPTVAPLPNGLALAFDVNGNAEIYHPPGPPIAEPASLTVAFGAPVQSITPSLAGGQAASLAIAAPAAHGTATVNGLTLNYAPNVGFAGSDSFTYTATNALGTSTAATVSITVTPPTLSVSPTSLANPQIGAAYSKTISVSGGISPYSYTVSAGALPAGLTLNALTGAIAGTPTAGGPAGFTVKATDSSTGSGPFSGTEAYTITVAPPTLALTPTSLPNPVAGIAYSQALTASGGTAPYSFAVTAGALPAGLSLDASTGVLSGTVVSVVSASFSVTASDSSTGTGPFKLTQSYTLGVAAPAPTASPLSVSTACNTPVAINLANGISGSGVTGAAIVSGPSHGTAQLSGETVTYTPASGFCNATDSFTYTASNAGGTSAPAIVTINIGQTPGVVAATAYVANLSDGTVSVIGTASGTVGATVPVGKQPDAVVATPDGSKAYVADFGANVLSVISTASNTVTNSVPVGSAPAGLAISPDGSTVYVANSAGASVSVVSTASDTVAGTIAISGSNAAPWGVAVSPDSSTLYVADRGQAQIEIIQAATGTVTGTIATGKSPVAVAFSPDGSHAYVANNGDGTVTVINTASKAAIGTITVGPAPTELAVSPDGTTLYVDNSNASATPTSGTVSVVSTATNKVTATIPVGLAPDGLAVTPDGTQLYVVNTGSNTVSVVSTVSNSAIDTIPVGQGPHGRGIFLGPATSSLAASVLPGGRSVALGTSPTVFATIVNAATEPANGCQIGLPEGAPAGLSLSYQTTNPATNAPTGHADTPASIAGNGGYQTYLLVFKATQPFTATNQPIDFFCDGILPAPVTIGVNTLDLTVSATPIADIVALAATATNDGTVHVATGGSGAFAVATIDLGAAANLIVSADTGSATLPVTVALCQTNPATGQCLAPPASTVAYSAAANGTPTFSVFVTASGPVAFAPGTSRIFVRFEDAGGAGHGSTSVAVETQ